jgi:hypothetical protein
MTKSEIKLTAAESKLLKRIAEAKDRRAICAIMQGIVKVAIEPRAHPFPGGRYFLPTCHGARCWL